MVNQRTMKDEEDSVNCVDVSRCTTWNFIGEEDDGDDDDDGLEAVAKNAIDQLRSEDEEDSVYCVDVSRCTTGSDIGDEDVDDDDDNAHQSPSPCPSATTPDFSEVEAIGALI